MIINGKEYTLAELKVLRDIIEKAIHSLDDTDALTGTTLFPHWSELLEIEKVFTEDDVTAGFRCQYNGKLYKLIQPHTVQETWSPDVATSLYAEVLIPDENVISDWKQPESTNPYKTGDKVKHNGKTWESRVDNNTWEPGVTGTENLWVEVTE